MLVPCNTSIEMVCASAELSILFAAFAADEQKKAFASDKKKKTLSRRSRSRYDKKMREKRAEEAALALLPVPDFEERVLAGDGAGDGAGDSTGHGVLTGWEEEFIVPLCQRCGICNGPVVPAVVPARRL